MFFYLLDHNFGERWNTIAHTHTHLENGFWENEKPHYDICAKWLSIQHLEPKTSIWKWLFQLDDEANLCIETGYSTISIHLRLVVWGFKRWSYQRIISIYKGMSQMIVWPRGLSPGVVFCFKLVSSLWRYLPTSIFQRVLFEPEGMAYRHPLASIQYPLEDPGRCF